jgi:hypothetical protein
MVSLIEERMAVLAERSARTQARVVFRWWKVVVYYISRVERLSIASSPARVGLHVGVVGSRDMFRGIVRDVITQVL